MKCDFLLWLENHLCKNIIYAKFSLNTQVDKSDLEFWLKVNSFALYLSNGSLYHTNQN